MDRIVLASGSPRRKQLLEWAEIPFDVVVSEVDENYPAGLTAEEATIHVARNKAKKVQEVLDEKRLVLAADTMVLLDDRIIGKPGDRAEAVEILGNLSGKKHFVITGVVMAKGKKEIDFTDRTEVWFHPLNLQQIEFYVDRYRPYDKAGAYAIQEWIGVVGIQSIQGDFYNVMGLPVSRVVKELNNWAD